MHGAGFPVILCAAICWYLPIQKEFPNTAAAAGIDELSCSAASIAAHVANIYYRV